MNTLRYLKTLAWCGRKGTSERMLLSLEWGAGIVSDEPQTQSWWVWFCCLLKTGLCTAVMENPISVPIKALLPWLLLLANLVTLVFMEKYLLWRTGRLTSFICFHFALMAHMLLWDLLIHPYPPSAVHPTRLVCLFCSMDSWCSCCLL